MFRRLIFYKQAAPDGAKMRFSAGKPLQRKRPLPEMTAVVLVTQTKLLFAAKRHERGQTAQTRQASVVGFRSRLGKECRNGSAICSAALLFRTVPAPPTTTELTAIA